jgi:L-asparaginase
VNKIHFIITGGTIDSVWSGASDTAVVAKHSIIPEYFEKLQRNLKLDDEIEFAEVCMKDSREITDEDRTAIVDLIDNINSSKIIITHGTYTMPVTARYLQNNLKSKDKTIILTGSMVPIEGFDYSDAPFNLGYAYSEVIRNKPGIYVCMNARTFNPDEVEKNTAEGKFYSTFQQEQ